jgi:hypothetical protein
MLFPGHFRRRTFLCALAAWAGAGAILPARLARGTRSVPQRGLPLAPGDGIPGIISTPKSPLDRTSAAIFERHLGSAFQIVAGSAAAPQLVHLTGVTRSQTITRTNGKAPESTPAFSLIFRGPVGPVLVQDTYRVKHPHLGEFPLFLVPIGPNQAEVSYEAVFA